MRLLPSHLADAKEMAKALYTELSAHQLPVGGLQATQEAMAKAFSYLSWRELGIELSRRHSPVYLDDLPAEQASVLTAQCALRLAKALGIESPTTVVAAFEASGAGCSPTERRRRRDQWSPWGLILNQGKIARGILQVGTSNQAGYRLDKARQARMRELYGEASEWYGSGGEVDLVAAAFPDEFLECFGRIHLPKIKHKSDEFPFEVRSGALCATDPCMSLDSPYCGQIPGVKNGIWYAHAGEDRIGIAYLHARHVDFRPDFSAHLRMDEIRVGVDAAMAGFFDRDWYAALQQDRDKAEGFCQEQGERLSARRDRYIVSGDFGVITVSGLGDGVYPCFVQRDDRGSVVSAVIQFLSEEGGPV